MEMSAAPNVSRLDVLAGDNRPRASDSILRGLLEMASAAIAGGDTPAHLLLNRALSLLQTHEDPGASGSHRGSGGLPAWSLNRVRRYIEENLERRTSLAQLAALSRLSASHFSRAFKESMGISPHAYLLSRRLARAQLVMIASDAPLSQIAIRVGFADQAHFSRHFKRTVGSPPNAWRRSRRSMSPSSGSVQHASM